MNRPSRTDEPQAGDGYNQNPPRISNDLTTDQDLNGISNVRALRDGQQRPTTLDLGQSGSDPSGANTAGSPNKAVGGAGVGVRFSEAAGPGFTVPLPIDPDERPDSGANGGGLDATSRRRSWLSRTKHAVVTFGKFVGPGFMVAVAYSKPVVL
jgi:metal iron transporter